MAGSSHRGPANTSSELSEGRTLIVGALAIGVTDVERVARFWSAALGFQQRRDGFEAGPSSWCHLTARHTARPADQPDVPQDHRRLHLDRHVADAAGQSIEVVRLVALGAALVRWDGCPQDPYFVVLADPAGNRFCVVDLGHDRVERAAA